MPIIIQSEAARVVRQGQGWQQVLLAGSRLTGSPAIAASRWSFAPHAAGPELLHGDCDEMLYVIAGNGSVLVNGERLALELESLLWLEPGDRYRFLAGEEGLELLQGVAPEQVDEEGPPSPDMD